MKRNNGPVIILFILMILSLAGGIIGYYQNNKEKENIIKEFKVSYIYYIDNVKTEQEVKNEKLNGIDGVLDETPAYIFSKYTCTKDVKGEWNNEEWKFIPNLTDNTTCSLYFTKNVHEVKLIVNNGKLPEDKTENTYNVLLNNEILVNLTPNEGYKFDKVECNNEVTAEYTENNLKITNVNKDSKCTVSFKINDFTVEIKIANGSIPSTEQSNKSANYGENLVFELVPAENYSFDSVTCTNNQNATFDKETGKLTVAGITDNTICTVQFSITKFQVNLEIEGGALVSTSTSQQIVTKGKNATFAVNALAGYTTLDATLTCTPEINKVFSPDETYTTGVVQIYNIVSDTNCKLTLNKE